MKINLATLRAYTTKWLAEAWETVMAKKDFVRGTFERTGLSLPLQHLQYDYQYKVFNYGKYYHKILTFHIYLFKCAADSSRDDYIQFDGEGVDPIMVDSDDDSDDSENQPICPAPSTGSTLTSLSFGEIII